MKKLQCELCGSKDFVRTDDGFFQCQYCGCKYTLEQAKTVLSGTVEIIKGQAELKQKLENAKIQEKLGEYEIMLQIYYSLRKDYPGELVVWESLLDSIYHLFLSSKKYSLTHTPNLLDDLQRHYDNAIRICGNNEDKIRINQKYTRFCEDFIDRIIKGEFDIIKSCSYHGFMESAFIHFIETFPNAKKILDISNQNIEGIKKLRIYPTKEGEWRINHDGIMSRYLIGKSFVHEDKRDIYFYVHELKEQFSIDNIKKYEVEAKTDWNTMTKCPMCGKELIGFGKRKCPYHNKTFLKIK